MAITPGGTTVVTGSSLTPAIAPRRMASAINAWPCSFAPRSAKKIAPDFTLRESQTIWRISAEGGKEETVSTPLSTSVKFFARTRRGLPFDDGPSSFAWPERLRTSWSGGLNFVSAGKRSTPFSRFFSMSVPHVFLRNFRRLCDSQRLCGLEPISRSR